MILRIIKLTLILTILPNLLFANTKFFEEGLDFYKKKNLRRQNLSLNKI